MVWEAAEQELEALAGPLAARLALRVPAAQLAQAQLPRCARRLRLSRAEDAVDNTPSQRAPVVEN